MRFAIVACRRHQLLPLARTRNSALSRFVGSSRTSRMTCLVCSRYSAGELPASRTGFDLFRVLGPQLARVCRSDASAVTEAHWRTAGSLCSRRALRVVTHSSQNEYFAQLNKTSNNLGRARLGAGLLNQFGDLARRERWAHSQLFRSSGQNSA